MSMITSYPQLLPREIRVARTICKQHMILRFLRDELFTTQDIAGILLSISSRQAVHKTLTKYEKEGLIRRVTVQLPDLSRLTLWGITSHGQGWAFDPQREDNPNDKVFEPARVALSVLRHSLDIQRLRIIAERAGWTDWSPCDRISGKWSSGTKRPDVIALDPRRSVTAIEVERSFKSHKRYEVILAGYLMAIKRQEIDRVIWISPSKDFCHRLRSIITGFKDLPVAGQKVTIDPDRHHINLFFADYAQWPYV